MKGLAVLVLLVTSLTTAGAQELPAATGLSGRPVLVLEPGMHTAAITRAGADRDGRYVVTGSLDKTMRVWSAADGQLLRTIRLPAGPDNIGRVYAVAISPDGALIAAGGFTRWTEADPQEQIYLFDRATGELVTRIEGLPQVVYGLAFSPDGRHLAATLGGGHGLRVYARDSNWAEVSRDPDYGDDSYGAAYARDGRLATASYDGQVRLYDAGLRLLAKTSAPGGQQPYGIAFSPDGKRLAVGHEGGTAVDLLDADSLDPLPGPDMDGLDNGDLGTIAWSVDGATLYAAGRYGRTGNPVVAWDKEGQGARQELAAAENSVMSLLPLAGGDLLVAAQDPYLARLSEDGTIRWEHRPPQADSREQSTFLAVSADGQQVDFGYGYGGTMSARFDLARLALGLERGPTGSPPRQGRTACPWQAGRTPFRRRWRMPRWRLNNTNGRADLRSIRTPSASCSVPRGTCGRSLPTAACCGAAPCPGLRGQSTSPATVGWWSRPTRTERSAGTRWPTVRSCWPSCRWPIGSTGSRGPPMVSTPPRRVRTASCAGRSTAAGTHQPRLSRSRTSPNCGGPTCCLWCCRSWTSSGRWDWRN
jgi:WD40 repeat protein